MQTIEREAFCDCNITKLVIEMENITFRSNEVFNHKNIKELVLLDTVKTIGQEAFSGCENITGELSLPGGLQIIGQEAFSGCSGIAGELKLPAGLENIYSNAFSECSSITTLTLPEGLQSIELKCF